MQWTHERSKAFCGFQNKYTGKTSNLTSEMKQTIKKLYNYFLIVL